MEYKQAPYYVIGVDKKTVMTVKIWCPMKLHKVNVKIDSVFWNAEPISRHSRQNSMVHSKWIAYIVDRFWIWVKDLCSGFIVSL